VTFYERRAAKRTTQRIEIDPFFQKPWKEDEIPVHFEGGATCDDEFARIHEEETRSKAT